MIQENMFIKLKPDELVAFRPLLYFIDKTIATCFNVMSALPIHGTNYRTWLDDWNRNIQSSFAYGIKSKKVPLYKAIYHENVPLNDVPYYAIGFDTLYNSFLNATKMATEDINGFWL